VAIQWRRVGRLVLRFFGAVAGYHRESTTNSLGERCMQAKGIVWLATRTPQAAAMRASVRDGLGLEPVGEQPGVAIFRA
jgi:hypothetical protein